MNSSNLHIKNAKLQRRSRLLGAIYIYTYIFNINLQNPFFVYCYVLLYGQQEEGRQQLLTKLISEPCFYQLQITSYFICYIQLLKLLFYSYLRCVLDNQICLDAIAIQPMHRMHTHSQTQRRTRSRVVCRIQSLCNIVSLEFYIIVKFPGIPTNVYFSFGSGSGVGISL